MADVILALDLKMVSSVERLLETAADNIIFTKISVTTIQPNG